jgi:N-acetylglutamate synthase-like GNAT family acetyltransferase
MKPRLMSQGEGNIIEERRGEFLLSTERERLDLNVIHGFLTASYWAKGIPRELVARSVQNSLCFGVYKEAQQVGFARVISDFATFAYIADVFVIESCRGQRLGKWMMEAITRHPRLQGLRRWTLATRDAHPLYAQFGFTPLKQPANFMELHDPNVYQGVSGEVK